MGERMKTSSRERCCSNLHEVHFVVEFAHTKKQQQKIHEERYKLSII